MALADFYRAGGTHAVLCHSPYEEVPIVKGEDFRTSYEITLKLAKKANETCKTRVFVALGPYPVLLLGLAERHGLEVGVDIMKKGLEAAQNLVLEKEAVGIGEIGRPHFPVSSEIWEASNDILYYGMELAAEASCPVILHTESGTPQVMAELTAMADRAGLERNKVIKHYSSPLVREDENYGLVPSILASRSAMREALSKGDRFLMETDFLDDPSRPGAVMNITTVPKRTKAFLASGQMDEAVAWRVHKDLPEKTYGVSIEVL